MNRHPTLRKNDKVQEPEPKVGQLRVWHIPQVPGKAFKVIVQTTEEARKIIPILWNYDKFQFENRIKPDYSNASGLEVYDQDNGEGIEGWVEWYNEEGNSISDIIRNKA